MNDDGTTWTLAAVAALTAAGLARRGSQSRLVYGPDRSRKTIAGTTRYKPITPEELMEVSGGHVGYEDDPALRELADRMNTVVEQGVSPWRPSRQVAHIMRDANDLLGFHGVERTHGVEYLNSGDMYGTTLIWDGEQFYIGDIGAILEDQTNLTHDQDEWLECRECGATDDDEVFAQRSLCRSCYVEKYGEEP